MYINTSWTPTCNIFVDVGCFYVIHPFCHSVVGPAVTFRVLPNSQNFTANDVSEKAGEYD